jgi:hypothetical protein
MKGIVKMIIEAATATFSDNKQEMSKFLYFLCKHGNYCCTLPFLTQE